MPNWVVGGFILLQKQMSPGPPLAPASLISNLSLPLEIAQNVSTATLSPPVPLASGLHRRTDNYDDYLNRLILNKSAQFHDMVDQRTTIRDEPLGRVDDFISEGGAVSPHVPVPNRSYESNRDELAAALVLNIALFTAGMILWLLGQCWVAATTGLRAGLAEDAPDSIHVPEDADIAANTTIGMCDSQLDDAIYHITADCYSTYSPRSGTLGKRNYLTYLLICMYTLLTLSVVNLMFLLPHGLVSKVLFGGWSIFMVLGEVSFWEIYLLTIVDGFVVFVYSELFRKLIELPEVDPANEKMRRTIWMQGLPTHDTMRWWRPFELNNMEIRRVASDLKDALTESLQEPEPSSVLDSDTGSAFGTRGSSNKDSSSEDGTSEQSVALPPGPPPVEFGNTQWRCYLDNGNPYYVNLDTRVTQWHPPVEIQQQLITPLGRESPVVEEINVALVLDGWKEAHNELLQAQEYSAAYESNLAKAERELATSNPLMWSWCKLKIKISFYEQQMKKLRPRIRKLHQTLQKVRQNKKSVSGSAFVTFKKAQYRSDILQEDDEEKMNLFAFWRHPATYFSFGRPPFASVTLTCERAPHPSDVNWSNLHVRWTQRVVVFWTLAILLMVCMIFVVTVVRISEFVVPMMMYFREKLDELEKMRIWQTYVPYSLKRQIARVNTEIFWKAMFEQVPTMVLLFINSIVVPQAIINISAAERSLRYSDAELRRMLVNFFFLFTTTVVVPFCNVASMSELVSLLFEALEHANSKPAEHLQNIIYGMPGVFALKYLLNATFLTNINQLLQIPQKLGSWVCLNFLAVTERDVVMYKTPWIFYWGYWYAWTLSIFSLGLVMSVACPSTLPVAALFFFMKYKVDKYNLDIGVYTTGTDLEGSLAVRVVCYLRMVVGIWWFAMGVCSYVFHYFAVSESLLGSEKANLHRGGLYLMTLGALTMLVSHWLKAQHLHLIQLHGYGLTKNPQILDEENWWVWMAVSLQLLSPERIQKHNSMADDQDDPDYATPMSHRGRLHEVSWDGARIMGLETRRARLSWPSPKTRQLSPDFANDDGDQGEEIPAQRAKTAPPRTGEGIPSRGKSSPPGPC